VTLTPELWRALAVLIGAYQGRAFHFFTAEGKCSYWPAGQSP